ncbi:hypothetical protein Q2K19_17290 [Micromonospora soli]|uniref:hypothetical protein n=1 Tax=Micromonospora sp. NBRC 110009 TaxID=3061627 RepID=UPI002671F666|nr:hypothetical protein [Micromonospora sp. NBRC 110009]WKT96004.1 hypothetical protein Q2K19_17290 [Micromonospora sp. NBRC 110009]
MRRLRIIAYATVMVAVGLFGGGCGRLGDAISGDVSARDCHPDPKTVAALRKEPMVTQAPPGATLAALSETVSCGWEGPEPINLGSLDRDITGAGTAGEVSRFYTDLARSNGWQALGQGGGPSTFDAGKPDGTHCSWYLQVRNTAKGTYHLQITYTPRDLRPTCL